MLSVDHLLIKHNMAAQLDLGTGWHIAFCAAEPWSGHHPALKNQDKEKEEEKVSKREGVRERQIEETDKEIPRE